MRLIPLFLALVAWPVAARADVLPPPAVRGVGVDEHLGRRIDGGLPFRDASDRPTTLASLFDGRRPVLMVLAYYRCPMLCGLAARSLATALSGLAWTPGRDYHLVTVSFDPEDRAVDASRARETALRVLGRPHAAWPFLWGAAPSIRSLTSGVGFRYRRDPGTGQLAHPSVALVLTGDGRLSRYLYGPTFEALGLKLALIEAGQGHIGSFGERVMTTCFRYDPARRRFGFWVLGFLRLGAVLILSVVAGLLGVLWWRERRRSE